MDPIRVREPAFTLAVRGLRSASYRVCAVVVLTALISGCASRPYQPGGLETVALWARAVTEVQGDVRVTAAVPTREETEAIFSLPLYDRGVQPVWLHIRNDTDGLLRLALVSVDRDYFSPIEVAYVHRGGYSKKGRTAMEEFLHEQGIRRYIPAGETVSGFVFTHLDPGTKSFNVDLYGNADDHVFTFFVDVPGFVPDHKEVDFDDLYTDEEMLGASSEQELRALLETLPCCSVDAQDNRGDPFNVVFVGSGELIARTVLQTRWEETEAGAAKTSAARMHLYRGRRPDATLQKSRKDGTERKELRLWLSPIRFNESPVWLAQISNDFRGGNAKAKSSSPYRIDPDIDEARMFLLQEFWFTQNLLKFGFVDTGNAATIDEPAFNFLGSDYITDGFVAVLLIAGRPVGLDEVERLQWDNLPGS